MSHEILVIEARRFWAAFSRGTQWLPSGRFLDRVAGNAASHRPPARCSGTAYLAAHDSWRGGQDAIRQFSRLGAEHAGVVHPLHRQCRRLHARFSLHHLPVEIDSQLSRAACALELAQSLGTNCVYLVDWFEGKPGSAPLQLLDEQGGLYPALKRGRTGRAQGGDCRLGRKAGNSATRRGVSTPIRSKARAALRDPPMAPFTSLHRRGGHCDGTNFVDSRIRSIYPGCLNACTRVE